MQQGCWHPATDCDKQEHAKILVLMSAEDIPFSYVVVVDIWYSNIRTYMTFIFSILWWSWNSSWWFRYITRFKLRLWIQSDILMRGKVCVWWSFLCHVPRWRKMEQFTTYMWVLYHELIQRLWVTWNTR